MSKRPAKVSTLARRPSLTLITTIGIKRRPNAPKATSFEPCLPPTHMHWKADSSTDECSLCGTLFSLFHRRHHCRCCGFLFCFSCSNFSMRLDCTGKFDSLGIESKVCSVCIQESHGTAKVQEVRIDSDDTVRKISPILIPQTINDAMASQGKTPLMSVPSDWSWSTF